MCRCSRALQVRRLSVLCCLLILWPFRCLNVSCNGAGHLVITLFTKFSSSGRICRRRCPLGSLSRSFVASFRELRRGDTPVHKKGGMSAPVLSQRPLTATTLLEAASAAVPVLRQGPRGVSGPIHGCSGPCGVSRRIYVWGSERRTRKVVNPNTFLLIKHSSLPYIHVLLYQVLAL